MNLIPLVGMAVEGESNFVYNPPKEGEFDFPGWSNAMLSVDENENPSEGVSVKKFEHSVELNGVDSNVG